MVVVKNFGVPVVKGWLEGTYFVPKPFDNSLLYRKAEALLRMRESVMLNSEIVEVDNRPAPPSHNPEETTDPGGASIRVVVENLNTGEKTLVLTKRILVASPPSLYNLTVLKLDAKEQSAFGSWGYFLSMYTAVVRTSPKLKIADGTSIFLSKPINGTSVTFSLVWNGLPRNYWAVLRSEGGLGAKDVESAILGVMDKIEKAETFSSEANRKEKKREGDKDKSEVVAISNHSQVAWGMSSRFERRDFLKSCLGCKDIEIPGILGGCGARITRVLPGRLQTLSWRGWWVVIGRRLTT